MENLQIVYLDPKDLTPYGNNARAHAKKERGKGIFGGGYLISEKAAAEKAAAEKAAAEKAAAQRWELSDREKAIVKSLNEET